MNDPKTPAGFKNDQFFDLSNYVPYTGAIADVDLGTKDIYTKDAYIKDRTVLQTESLRNGALTAVGHQSVTPDFTTSIFKFGTISTPLYPQVGQRVHFSASTSLPTGISSTVLYWVVNVVPHVSFQVSLTSGGAPVTFTTNGTGVQVGFDWTPEGDCTWDLVNGKAIFAYSTGATAKFYQHMQGGSNQKAGGLIRGLAYASEYKLTYTISNVTGTPQAFIPNNSWVNNALNIDTTAGTHTIYFNTSHTATGNASFEINANLTAGQGFTIDDISVQQVYGGEQTMAGKLSVGTPKGIQQDSKVRVMNTTENRTLDLTRYVYSPITGNFPTQIYNFESWSYTTSNQQTQYAVQSFIADYRAILNTIGTTIDTVVNLSASLTQGGYYQSRFNEGSGLYNQLADFATYASPNATSTTKKMWGVQSKIFGFTPVIDVVSTLTYSLYGQQINMSQYAPTITRGALDFTFYGMNVTGGTPSATGTTRMYAYYNDMTGFGTNWTFYNNTANHNFLGKDNSKTYFGTGFDASTYFDGSHMYINSENVTANDELRFTNFDKYSFDNDVISTHQGTFGQNGVTGWAEIGSSSYGGYFTDPGHSAYLANGNYAGQFSDGSNTVQIAGSSIALAIQGDILQLSGQTTLGNNGGLGYQLGVLGQSYFADSISPTTSVLLNGATYAIDAVGTINTNTSFAVGGVAGYTGDLNDSTSTKIADVVGGIITAVYY